METAVNRRISVLSPRAERSGVFGDGGFAAAVLALFLVSTLWDLHRPLPPPRVSRFIQITHDGRRKWLAGVDASRLYANEVTLSSIEQVPITGGELAQIRVPVPGGPGELIDVSPDGSHLLTGTAEEGKPFVAIWNVRILDGSYRRLGYGLDASYSPDGTSVVYTTLEGDIWLVQTDGTGARKLGPTGAKADWPALSPDGGTIRFSRDDGIWEISSNGSKLHPLLPGWHTSGAQCCGRWTPDGKFFVFTSNEAPTSGYQIWAVDERRGLLRHPPAEPVQLTTGPTSWGPPYPGKDEKKIFACGSTLRGELSRIDPATKEIKPFLAGTSADNVSFSRDGHLVAYVSFPQGVLWKANRDGSNPVQLTDPPSRLRIPAGRPMAHRFCSPRPLAITFTPTLSPRTAVSPNGFCLKTMGDRAILTGRRTGRKLSLIQRRQRMPRRETCGYSTSKAAGSQLFQDRLAHGRRVGPRTAGTSLPSPGRRPSWRSSTLRRSDGRSSP